MAKAKSKQSRQVKRRHHKVEQLPPSLFDEVADRLRRGETYETVEAWLRQQGHPVSSSSLHRWHKFITEGMERIRERALLAEQIVRGTTGADPTAVQSAAYQIAMQQALEFLIDLETGETEASVLQLSKLMTALARMGGTSTQLARHIEEQRKKKIAADRKVAQMADDGALSPEAVMKIQQIYGITVS